MGLPRILYLEFNNLLTLVLNSNICLLMKLSVVIFTGCLFSGCRFEGDTSCLDLNTVTLGFRY